jgi:hypothetical protein
MCFFGMSGILPTHILRAGKVLYISRKDAHMLNFYQLEQAHTLEYGELRKFPRVQETAMSPFLIIQNSAE